MQAMIYNELKIMLQLPILMNHTEDLFSVSDSSSGNIPEKHQVIN